MRKARIVLERVSCAQNVDHGSAERDDTYSDACNIWIRFKATSSDVPEALNRPIVREG